MAKNPDAVAEAEPRAPETMTLMRMVKHTYSPEERIAEGAALSDLITKRAAKEEDLKAIRDQYKADISMIEKEAATHQRNFDNGFVFRDEECTEYRDFDHGRVWIVRNLTGEIVEDRKMTPGEIERQRALFDDPAPDGADA